MRRYDESTSFEENLDELINHIWYPKKNSNPGFDAIVFIWPVGEERKRENLVVMVIECRFSDSESKTKLSIPADVLSKYNKAKINIHSNVSWVKWDRCVFCRCAQVTISY